MIVLLLPLKKGLTKYYELQDLTTLQFFINKC